MAIRRIRVKNFKCFDELDIELGNLNILIGANASGKSNFLQIFKFLRDISTEGLENAISRQGGVKYLRNLNIGTDKPLYIGVTLDYEGENILPNGGSKLSLKIEELFFKFQMKFRKDKSNFTIEKDELVIKYKVYKIEGVSDNYNYLGNGDSVLSNRKGEVKWQNISMPEKVSIAEEYLLPIPFGDLKSFISFTGAQNPLIAGTLSNYLTGKSFLIRKGQLFPSLWSLISIYDFNPKLPQQATPITGKADLEEDGSNLAIVLRDIKRNKKNTRKFLNLLTYVLPYVKDIGVKKYVDKSLMLSLQEIFTEKEKLPAFLISDGTINITALIIALYFEEHYAAVFEEPDKGIHPHLISKLIKMMKEASQNKQIFVTTHNPEMVKHADLNDVLLVSRDKNGFARIDRPAEKKDVKVFLDNELGLEELYIDETLEALV